MTELMYLLYDHIRLRELPKYCLTDEYREAQKAVEAQRQDILKKYPGIDEQLNALLEEKNFESALEMEAMFQAAFSLGIRLPQLL